MQDVNVYGFRLRVGLNGLVERPSGILDLYFWLIKQIRVKPMLG